MKNSILVVVLAFLTSLDASAAIQKPRRINIEESKLPAPLQSVLESQYELGSRKLGSGGVSKIQVFELSGNKKISATQALDLLIEKPETTGTGALAALCSAKIRSCAAYLNKNHQQDLVLSTFVHYLTSSTRRSGFENYQFSTLMLQNFILETVGRDYIEISSRKETDAKEILTSALIRRDGSRAIVLNYDIMN